MFPSQTEDSVDAIASWYDDLCEHRQGMPDWPITIIGPYDETQKIGFHMDLLMGKHANIISDCLSTSRLANSKQNTKRSSTTS